MILGEDEAEKKWCPHARVGSTDSGLGGFNRGHKEGPMPEALCIASKCMAWRWQKREPGFEVGYCGLSGAAS